MVAMRATLPDLNLLDQDELKAILLTTHEELVAIQEKVLVKNQQLLIQEGELLSRAHEIEHLKLLIAKLRRMQFGRKSEKVERQIEQLELKLEDLQVQRVEPPPQPAREAGASKLALAPKNRRPLPEHLPRETRTHEPAESACPECGGVLKKLGEDVSEILEWVPASFKVIRHVRPKLCCAGCDKIVQAPAPSRPIDRGLAGPGLLAHVLTSKFADHLPLYRQSEIYAREGVELDRSTMAKWVGEASHLLEPLVEALRRYVMGADKLHADDTPVPCWLRETARPRPGAYGPMFAMIVRAVRTPLQRPGLPTRPTARGNTRSSISVSSAAFSRPTLTPASISSTRTGAYKKLRAWPISGASSTT